MGGFIRAFAKKFPDDPNPEKIMGYHNAKHVWMYDWLASEFLICQRWFAAHPGPTFCNRFYTLTGRLNRDSSGNWEPNNFSGKDFKPVFTRTIFDHLTEHGVSWHYYENRYCTLRLFQAYTFDNTTLSTLTSFTQMRARERYRRCRSLIRISLMRRMATTMTTGRLPISQRVNS
jgi:phospholipase C